MTRRTEDLPDTLLLERPGLEAEQLVHVLNLEGVPCLLSCEGVRRLRLPDSEPGEPLAVTLPVSIYVPAARLVEANEILQSLQGRDATAGQWAEASTPRTASAPPQNPRGADPPAPGLRPEGTSLRLLVALAVAALLFLWKWIP